MSTGTAAGQMTVQMLWSTASIKDWGGWVCAWTLAPSQHRGTARREAFVAEPAALSPGLTQLWTISTHLQRQRAAAAQSYPVPHQDREAGMALEKASVLFQGQGCTGITEHIPEQHQCDKCMKRVLSLQN